MWRVGHSHGPGVPLGGQWGSPGSAHPERPHSQATSTGDPQHRGPTAQGQSLHSPLFPEVTVQPLPLHRRPGRGVGRLVSTLLREFQTTGGPRTAALLPRARRHPLTLSHCLEDRAALGRADPQALLSCPRGVSTPCPVNRTSETNSEPCACPLPHGEEWACGVLGGQIQAVGTANKTWPQAPPPVQLLISPPTLPCSNSSPQNQELGEPVRQEASRKPFWPRGNRDAQMFSMCPDAPHFGEHSEVPSYPKFPYLGDF